MKVKTARPAKTNGTFDLAVGLISATGGIVEEVGRLEDKLVKLTWKSGSREIGVFGDHWSTWCLWYCGGYRNREICI